MSTFSDIPDPSTAATERAEAIVAAGDPAAAYAQDFIELCAFTEDGTRIRITQALRKIPGFRVNDFKKLVNAASFHSYPHIKPNGHAPSNWKTFLERSATGIPKPRLSNAMLALRLAPEWRGVIGFNLFSNRIHKTAPPPYQTGSTGIWTDTDDIKTAEWLQLQGIEIGVQTAFNAAKAIAEEHPFHPIREYLSSLKWDGEKRISRWLTTFLGVEWSELSSAYGSKWLISAVARIFNPGCKVDTCLVLEGGQGAFKSTALSILASDEYFTDQIADLDNKDSSQDLPGKWIVELCEIERFNSKHHQGVIKAFIPRRSDHYRQSFGRHSQDFPRQCVFAASTNKDTWAGDETGARRWWPVRCGSIDIPALQRHRDQLWAEATALFLDNSPWWIDNSSPIIQASKDEQASRYELDPWDSIVTSWLSDDEKKFLSDEAANSIRFSRPIDPYFIQTDSILEICLKKPIGSWTQQDKNRVSKILVFHGFERFQRRVTTTDGLPVYSPDGKLKREWYYRRKLY